MGRESSWLPSTRREFLIRAAAAPVLCASAAVSEPVRVLSVPDNGIQPQIALAENGLHLTYFSGDSKHGDVFYARSDNFGRTFSSRTRVNSQAGSAIAIGSIRGAQIAVGKRYRVHVAWNGSDVAEPSGPINPEAGKPGSPMLYARLNDGGTAFEGQRNLMHETFGLDGGGSVAADQNGNVYVGWHGKAPGAAQGEAGREVWIAWSTDEGRTFPRERAAAKELTGACGCCALRLFVDSRGALYGLYRSATQNVHRDIYLLRSVDTGKTFSVARLHPWDINGCPMSGMAFIEAHEQRALAPPAGGLHELTRQSRLRRTGYTGDQRGQHFGGKVLIEGAQIGEQIQAIFFRLIQDDELELIGARPDDVLLEANAISVDVDERLALLELRELDLAGGRGENLVLG